MGEKNMRTAGWVWEGLAFDPGVDPSVMGLGEGMKYLGLSRANFIFHPNNRYNLEKLADAFDLSVSELLRPPSLENMKDHLKDLGIEEPRAYYGPVELGMVH